MTRFVLISLLCSILILLSACPKTEKQEPKQEEPEESVRVETYKAGESFFGTALYIAEQIVDYYEKTVCLDIISDHLCNAEKFDKAAEIARTIEDDYTRAQSIGRIAQYMMDKGMVDESVKLVDDVREITAQLSDPMEKSTLLTLCILIYRKAGFTDKEKEVKNEVDSIIKSLKTKFPIKDPSSDPSSDIVSKIDTDIDEVRNLAHELDFIGALTKAKSIEYKPSRACAISYIGAVKAETHDDITDEEIVLLKELMIFSEPTESD